MVRLKKTMLLLMIFNFMYLIFPLIASELIFNSNFYIYSNYQSKSILPSVATFILISAMIFFIFNREYKLDDRALFDSNSFIIKLSFYSLIIYCFVVFFVGMHYKLQGTPRVVMLAIQDKYFFSGLAFLILAAITYVISPRRNLQFFALIFSFLIVDFAFSGKIFSFLAFILIVFRMDCLESLGYAKKRSILPIIALGVLFVLVIWAMRLTLAGKDAPSDVVSIIYTVASEFMGVQASVGWAIHYSIVKINTIGYPFVSTLEPFYIGSVGHGLAISTAAYFVGMFGSWWFAVEFFYLLFTFLLILLFKKQLGPFAPLVIALNFQHFMRHGVDVFTIKLITQIIFMFLLVAYLSMMKKSINVRNSIK